MYFTLLEDKGLCLGESSNSKRLTCLRINYKLLLSLRLIQDSLKESIFVQHYVNSETKDACRQGTFNDISVKSI